MVRLLTHPHYQGGILLDINDADERISTLYAPYNDWLCVLWIFFILFFFFFYSLGWAQAVSLAVAFFSRYATVVTCHLELSCSYSLYRNCRLQYDRSYASLSPHFIIMRHIVSVHYSFFSLSCFLSFFLSSLYPYACSFSLSVVYFSVIIWIWTVSYIYRNKA